MFDLISSLYNGLFVVFFSFINLVILCYFLQALKNLLFGEEEVKSGYILVTGCDSGFGRGVALELNTRNIYVFAACLTADGVQRFTDDRNFKGMAFIMNITNEEDIQKAKNNIEEKVKGEGLWCVINNAGVLDFGPIEWMSVKDMKQCMEVNVWGTVNVTKIMLPLVQRCHGRIVIMTSIAGRVAKGYFSAYCMSKYALEAFSDSLRHEMKPWGVSVHIIEPGIHLTSLFGNLQKRWKELWDIQPNIVQEKYGKYYCEEGIKRIESTISKVAADPQNVINAYIHASLSSKPRMRYVVGLDAKTAGVIMGLLPTAMGDFIYDCKYEQLIPAAMKNAN